MTADFRCDCGHAMSAHALSTTDDRNEYGCSLCDCEVHRLQEPGVQTEVQEAATSTHDLFQSYLAAGFTRDEALHLTTAVTVEGMRLAT